MPVLAAVAVPHPPLILPAVGKGEEQKIARTISAYRQAMKFLSAYKPDTIIITSPHAPLYADYFHVSGGERATGDMMRFNAPFTKLTAEYDTEFVRELEQQCEALHFPCGTKGTDDGTLDHATFIPLYFLNEVYQNYKVVRIGISGLSLLHHYDLGRIITAVANKLNRRIAIIASGDLSHKLLAEGPYGFAPEGPLYDRKITTALNVADFATMLEMPPELCDNASECGHRSFVIMAGTLDGMSVKSELLSYEGPFGVGYGVAKFEIVGTDKNRFFGAQHLAKLAMLRNAEDPYVHLARQTVEHFVKTGKAPETVDALPEELLNQRAGAFVSLKKHGQLRGCIGTTQATQASLALEIVQNAISACSRDPRFKPVRPEELSELEYSVDVLAPAEPVKDEKELDAKKYGVIVRKDSRQGLLLPDLEGVNTPAEQIAIAKQKAGIAPEEEVELWRFEVVRHK